MLPGPELRRLATQRRVDLQPDWRAFSVRVPTSINVAADRPLPEWPGVTTPGRAPGADWVDDVAEVFGAEALCRQLAKKRPQLHFWDQRLLRHAYPVARTMGGDPIVQVAGGRLAGHVLRTNHENWDGFFEHLAKLGERRVDDDFEAEAGPLLRRLGYVSGAPTTDQVIGVLLHRRFDGATRLTKSFADFYRAIWRARRPERSRIGSARGSTSAPRVLEIPTSARRISANRERAYLGGLHGDALVAVASDGTVDRVASYPRITGIVASATSLYVSDLGALRASDDGGKSFAVVLRGRIDAMATDEGNRLWLSATRGDKNVLFYSTDWKKFAAVPAPTNGLVVVHGSGAGGVLVSSFDELFVGKDGKPPTSLGVPEQYERIDVAIATSKGTLLVGTTGALMRSTNEGKTWRSVKLGARGVTCLFAASDDSIIAATGKRLWLSRDDGRSFGAVQVRVADAVWAGAELGRELLLVAESQLVRLPLSGR